MREKGSLRQTQSDGKNSNQCILLGLEASCKIRTDCMKVGQVKREGPYTGGANEKTRACNNHSQVLHIYRRNQVNCARRAAKTEGRQEEQEKAHNRKHKTQNRHEKTDNSQVGGEGLVVATVNGLRKWQRERGREGVGVGAVAEPGIARAFKVVNVPVFCASFSLFLFRLLINLIVAVRLPWTCLKWQPLW